MFIYIFYIYTYKYLLIHYIYNIFINIILYILYIHIYKDNAVTNMFISHVKYIKIFTKKSLSMLDFINL